MIYITGDCHLDYHKFNIKNFPEQKDFSQNDYIIICGDFGYWDESSEQKFWIKWLSNKPFTILFIDGNHENFDLLNKLPISKWNGGNVHFISKNIIHLMRGQVFTIENKTFFTFGGAQSHDIKDGILDKDDKNFKTKLKEYKKNGKEFRINHISWWKEEMPNDNEYKEGIFNLNKYNWNIDYIITHATSTSIQEKINENIKANKLTDYFEYIKNNCNYKQWFFGHYHKNQMITSKDILLYEDIIKL